MDKDNILTSNEPAKVEETAKTTSTIEKAEVKEIFTNTSTVVTVNSEPKTEQIASKNKSTSKTPSEVKNVNPENPEVKPDEKAVEEQDKIFYEQEKEEEKHTEQKPEMENKIKEEEKEEELQLDGYDFNQEEISLITEVEKNNMYHVKNQKYRDTYIVCKQRMCLKMVKENRFDEAFAQLNITKILKIPYDKILNAINDYSFENKNESLKNQIEKWCKCNGVKIPIFVPPKEQVMEPAPKNEETTPEAISKEENVTPKEESPVKKEGEETTPKEDEPVKKEGTPQADEPVKKEGTPNEYEPEKKEGGETAPNGNEPVKKEGEEGKKEEKKEMPDQKGDNNQSKGSGSKSCCCLM